METWKMKFVHICFGILCLAVSSGLTEMTWSFKEDNVDHNFTSFSEMLLQINDTKSLYEIYRELDPEKFNYLHTLDFPLSVGLDIFHVLEPSFCHCYEFAENDTWANVSLSQDKLWSMFSLKENETNISDGNVWRINGILSWGLSEYVKEICHKCGDMSGYDATKNRTIKSIWKLTQSNVIFSLKKIYVNVNIDANLLINNVIIYPYPERVYCVNVLTKSNTPVTVSIRNSTFESFLFILDYQNLSLVSENNLMVKSGFHIKSSLHDYQQQIVIHNCSFKGNINYPLINVENAKNVSITSSNLTNVETKRDLNAIVCSNSQITLQNVAFQSCIAFDDLFTMSNCQVSASNIVVRQNRNRNSVDSSYLSIFHAWNKSVVNFNKSVFEENYRIQLIGLSCTSLEIDYCYFINNQIFSSALNPSLINSTSEALCNNTILDVRNTKFINNTKLGLSFHGYLVGAEYSKCNFENVTFENNIFLPVKISSSQVHIQSCFFIENVAFKLLTLFESSVNISNSLFNENVSGSIQGHSSNITILETNFTKNYRNSAIFVKDIERRFPPGDVDLKGFFVNITHCLFYQNVAAEGAVIWAKSKVAKISFKNCKIINNEASKNVIGYIQGANLAMFNCTISTNIVATWWSAVLYLNDGGTLELETTIMKNNRGSIYARTNSTVSFNKSKFTNNMSSAPSGGAIYLEDESTMISKETEFTGNTAVTSGAIAIKDHSIFYDSGNVFNNNTGSSGGAISVSDHSSLISNGSRFTSNSAQSSTGHTSVPNCPEGLRKENDGGAVILQTYSNASIHNCHFGDNHASRDGGAIHVNKRSVLNVANSSFMSNRARNSGGSIFIHFSKGEISTSSFQNESARFGSGGSISIEIIGNVTIFNSTFNKCHASQGGSVAIRTVSVAGIKSSTFAQSTPRYDYGSMGGSILLTEESHLDGTNVTISLCTSQKGAGIYVSDSSYLNLSEFNISGNIASHSGGAMSCYQSKVMISKGRMETNSANKYGGAFFIEDCHITTDNVIIFNNTAQSGGGLYCQSSEINIHNTHSQGNKAENLGGFMLIGKNSMARSNFLTLSENIASFNGDNVAVINESTVILKHTTIVSEGKQCAFYVKKQSHLKASSSYLTNHSELTNGTVCVDKTSNSFGLQAEEYPEACERLCRCYSDPYKSVTVADCTNSNLTEIPSSLPRNLDYLLMSENKISYVNFNNSFMLNLTKLDLGGNKLSDLSQSGFDSIQYSQILSLNLSYNKLESLPKSIVKFKSLKKLQIDGNIFQCTCDNIWMKNWILNRSVSVENYKDVKCKMNGEIWIPIVTMDDVDMGCISNTSSEIWIIAVIATTGLVITILAAIAAKKWELIKFWLFQKYGFKFKDKTELMDLDDIDYDAFLNYSAHDHGWVREEIVRILENHSYTLCLHLRDFAPTATITHNITVAVKHSRRMISLVSRNYLNSNWCKEEFSLGHLESIEGRFRFIILIMLDDIDVGDLPDEMQKYIKSRTYISAVKLNNRKDLELFKTKLLYAMPQTPIAKYNVDMNEEYNPNVPPLFNRMYTYREMNRM